MPKRTYITTPIYYVNAAPHVGHALTMLVCDVERRHGRMRGEDVYFVTGTDENATKVAEAAEAAGTDPQAFVDEVSQSFRDCWADLEIEYDDFVRTTEPRHVTAVQRMFEILREQGHIYLDKYEGWYDVSAETFVKEPDLVDGKSPDGNEVRWISEENWFFRLSAFGERLLAHIEAHPEFLMPEGRKNEVVSFIKSGLRDMCVTRQNTGWGIPVPGDETKVVYVWFDALVNYLAATGWPGDGWEALWPADTHWMAKEIFTRFHATLWPAMLMGAGLPLPKTVIAHGWFNFGGTKMSKSGGNLIKPTELTAHLQERSGCSPELAVDAARFSIVALLPYEGDTNFTLDEVERRFNADLANDLGNALNRSLSMAHRFVAGTVPEGPTDPEVLSAIVQAKADFDAAVSAHRIDRAVDACFAVVQFLNKWIDTRAPWALAKANDPSLGTVLRSMLMALRATEGLVRPVMPRTADAVAAQLGLPPLTSWGEIGAESSLPAGHPLGAPQPMFPRIELKPVAPESPKPSTAAGAAKPEKAAKAKFEPPSEIEFAEFMRVNLRIGRIVEAEPVEGSEKLTKLQVMIGEERRQIIAGIARKYAPIDLIGRQVVVVANLKPARLMGQESQGMLLAADDTDGAPILLQPEHEAPEGSSVH